MHRHSHRDRDDDGGSSRRRDRYDDRESSRHRDRYEDRGMSREERKAAKRAAKAAEKLKETPEEKRARRLEKKRRKHGDAAVYGKDAKLFGYSNDSNPFGDANLLTPFTWQKKTEKVAQERGVSVKKVEKEEKRRDRRREIEDEVNKVKRRRKEREEERRLWEEEKERMAREADAADGQDWHTREENFHKEQAKIRTSVRLKEYRAKPIDIVAKNLDLDATAADVEVRAPYLILGGLDVHEIRELRNDIETRIGFGEHLDYWKPLKLICDDEIAAAEAALAARDGGETGGQFGGRAGGGVGSRYGHSGIHRAIEGDVYKDLSGKSKIELEALRVEVEARLALPGVDAEYWEAVLKRVGVQEAKASLDEIHKRILRERLVKLQQRQREVAEAEGADALEEKGDGDEVVDSLLALPGAEGHQAAGSSGSPGRAALGSPSRGRCISPPPVLELGPDEVAELPETDAQEIQESRRMVAQRYGTARQGGEGADDYGNDSMVAEEARKGMAAGDSAFNIESPLIGSQGYWWQDKYRPRKPRYFNRVHTGYEWNKYNSTHYDHDNPPPKIVQGYKFNIFYPDLVDPTKTPTYFLEPGPNPDTAVIRFHAGPPYEDIAFKIVNKEWEHNKRTGFKCTFERGVLHLYFRFTRYRYRK